MLVLTPRTRERIRADRSEQPARSSIKQERNLFAAVLARAILDCYGSSCIEPHLQKSAEAWLFAEINTKHEFSFGWIAIHLDLCPYTLQAQLGNFRENPTKLQKCIQLLR